MVPDETEAKEEENEKITFHDEEPRVSHLYVVIDGAKGWITSTGQTLEFTACCLKHHFENRATEMSVVIKGEGGEVLRQMTLEHCSLVE